MIERRTIRGFLMDFSREFVLARTLAVSSPAAHAEEKGQWVELSTPHFTVVSDAGEKNARMAGTQFEAIRDVFHTRFPGLRLDAGRPFVVIAARNEDTMKAFLPAYWRTAGATHPIGVFIAPFDTYFAVVRTDGFGMSSYQTVYHQDTHALLRLNFTALPLWLNEGLAQYYQNTVIADRQADVGRASDGLLFALQRATLIPFADLMKVDQRSPLYRESDHASVFYPESWAIVHYLMSDTDALKQDFLGRFVRALDDGMDGEAAARQAFGDLNRFERTILAYARQRSFYFTRTRLAAETSSSDALVRALTPAEATVARAEFLFRTGESGSARPLLAEALRLAPELARVHSAVAYDEYQQSQANASPSAFQSHSEAAEKEFRAAAAMGLRDFRVHYYLGLLLYRRNSQAATDIAAELEQSIALNPDFAPARAFLARAYRQLPGMSEKAVDTVLRAVRMEPSSLAYRLELGDTLLELRRYEEARTVAESVDTWAQTAAEKTAAQALLQRVMAAQTAGR